MAGIGIPELIIVLVILLVIFGPKRLPGLGRSLGSGMREFKESVTGSGKDDADERPALDPAPAPTAATTTSPPAAAATPAVTPAQAQAQPEPAGAESSDAARAFGDRS